MYMASFNSTINRYRELLSEQNTSSLKLPNDNLDVGTSTAAGKYKLTDAAYSQLLHKLQGHYTELPQELRGDILGFYRDLGVSLSTKTNDNEWARLLKEIDHLQSVDADLRHPTIAGVAAPVPR
jgi:muramidase (phage lysozyme)